MKAIVLKGFGGVENLVNSEIEVPEISDHEVLVKVKAFSINPVDIKTRMGYGLASRLKEFSPMILGWDISGSVSRTGKSVTSFSPGDEVFGMVNFPGIGKAYAEYVAAPDSHLALKPSNITHEEAAAATLAALTAWQIVKLKSGINHGDRVLIHAAAGGVGHFAVQMSKYLGAYVIGTASAKNSEFVLGLGAAECIDYENQRFEEVVKNIDFVLDTIGGDYIDRSLNVLKKTGKIISIPSGAAESVKEKAAARGLTGETFRVWSDGQNMQEISDLMKAGIVKATVSRIFEYMAIQSAHLLIETGKTRGKIVLTFP